MKITKKPRKKNIGDVNTGEIFMFMEDDYTYLMLNADPFYYDGDDVHINAHISAFLQYLENAELLVVLCMENNQITYIPKGCAYEVIIYTPELTLI